jgi:hypothetical protein
MTVAIRWLLIVLAALLDGPVAGREVDAPPLMAWSISPSAGSGRTATPSHAWIVTPDSDGRVSLVWHVPPRGGRLFLGAPPGSVRLAADIPAVPVAAAAVGERLYLAFEERKAMPDGSPRQVLSLDAVPAGEVAGEVTWVTRPAGRLDAAASLRGDGRLVDLSGGGSLHALMHGLRDHDADPTRVSLLAMVNAQWREVTLPAELVELSRRGTQRQGNRVSLESPWRLVSMPSGVSVVTLVDGALLIWTATRVAERHAAGGEGEAAAGGPLPATWYHWRFQRVATPLSDTTILPRLMSDGREMLAFETAADGLWRVWSRATDAPETSPWRLVLEQRLEASSVGEVAAVGMAGVASGDLVSPGLLALTQGQTHGESKALGGGRMLVELSPASGRVLSAGPLAPRHPVSAADYRLMGVLLLLVLGTVIVFLARPPGFEATPVTLPRQACLADPLRRLVAGGIDLFIVCVIGTAAWGLPVRVLVAAEWWGGGGSMTVLATILVLLIVQGGVSEWLFGRTPGKLMAGCAVIGARPHPETGLPMGLSLARAMVRNMLKWLAPLVAITGLLDPTRRHRGDQWSGSVVVERLPDDTQE